ncbi:MAG: hypothetical protein ACRDRZ_16955 [Pseudonocardiaceae bacterium]
MTLLLPAAFSAPEVAGVAESVVPGQQPRPPEEPGGQGEDFGKSSPVGLVVIILFFLAVALLVRSMNKHLRRIPESFDPPEKRDEPDAGPEGSTQR